MERVQYANTITLWEKYGNPEVATWDMDKHLKPVARS